jgi:hypothetical protein
MPTWVKVAIDSWTSAAGVVAGHVLRRVNRADQAQGERMSEKVVWQLLQPYATAAGVPGIAPHDLRRYAEFRTMPNRYEGCWFGIELVANAINQIRHSPSESEALQKG